MTHLSEAMNHPGCHLHPFVFEKTHIQLQFRPLSADGILFYVAQHLKAQSGKLAKPLFAGGKES